MAGRTGIGEKRAWSLAFDKARALERAWDDPSARLRELLSFRRWLEERSDVPRLSRLAPLLAETMDRRALECVVVPIERAAARQRVTDVQILSGDSPGGPSAAASPVMPLTIVADSLRSAFNIGGIFRGAECFGAAALWLCGYSADPSASPHVAEAALGAEKLVPWRAFRSSLDAIAALRAAGARVVALETVAGALPAGAFAWTFPCALVLGNERFGLSPDVVAACDACVRIPMHGRKNSLNVATAAAVALYCARTAFDARDARGEGEDGRGARGRRSPLPG